MFGCVMALSLVASLAFGQPASAPQDNEALAQVRLLEKTRRKEMSGWRPLLNSKIKSVRLAAVRAVGQANVHKALPILRTAVADPNPQIQDAALFSLLQLGELDAETLVNAVTSTADITTKANRIRLIGFLDTAGFDQATLTSLLEGLLTSTEEKVVAAFLNALRQRATGL